MYIVAWVSCKPFCSKFKNNAEVHSLSHTRPKQNMFKEKKFSQISWVTQKFIPQEMSFTIKPRKFLSAN
jgi:hypothetical protein